MREAMIPSATVPTINPDGIYDDALLRSLLGVSAQTLATARRKQELRFTQKGKRTLYLGSWVLTWLEQSSKEACRADGGVQ
jgi:hypothetical protein